MAALARALVTILSALSLPAAGEEDAPWEWAGAFVLKAGETYTWSFARNAAGKYVEPTMTLAVVSAGGPGEVEEAKLHGTEDKARALWAKSPTSASSGSSVDLGNEAILRVTFDQASWLTLVRFKPAGTGSYVFFAEHSPAEFENGFHFLKDEEGHDAEAYWQEPAEAAAVARTYGSLGTALGAAAVTAAPSLVLILVVGLVSRHIGSVWLPGFFGFASGAIFGAAVFLLLPEGFVLAGAEQDDVTQTWTWGTMILVGWFVALLMHHGSDIVFEAVGKRVAAPKANDPDNVEDACSDCKANTWAETLAVAGPVLLGDSWHNFVDGMLIGLAARACDSGVLWALVGASVAHEVPQEVADLLLLVNKAGLKWYWATVWNSLSAFVPTMVGAAIGFEADVSKQLQGLLLAFGAGVFLFIALSELADTMLHLQEKRLRDSLLRVVPFVLGATCIGLVLLDHEHCEAGETVAGAAAHNH